MATSCFGLALNVSCIEIYKKFRARSRDLDLMACSQLAGNSAQEKVPRCLSQKKAGIVLILETMKDRKYWIRLNTTIEHFNLPIDTWSVGNAAF